MKATPTERIGWFTANCLLLIAALLIAFCMNGCMSYSKAVRKFGHLAKDSAVVTIQDTVRIPKDSVILSLKTDTTTIHRIIEQGRARIIYDRTNTITTVKAECKADTIIRTLQAKCPPVASFGIAPWYRWAFYIAAGLLLVAILAYVLSYKLKLSLAKR